MITIAIAVLTTVVLYLYGTRTYNYWSARGVKHDKPLPIIGNCFKKNTGQQSLTQLLCHMYWKYPKEKVIGYFDGTEPALVIRDPEIAKRILTTDFSYFYPRGMNPKNSKAGSSMRNLFCADGDLWKLLRQRITPFFSTGRLKAMFPLIVEQAEKLKVALTAATNGQSKCLDARDLMARYTTDFIGAVGFGISADSITDNNSVIRKIGVKIFTVSVLDILGGMLNLIFPFIAYLPSGVKELLYLLKKIQQQRNYEPSDRHDFIDLMLECKKMGKIIGDSIEKTKLDGTPETVTVEVDDRLIAAQVAVFFVAGFETSSSVTSFTLHQLAFHLEKQKKVQAEIDKVLAKYDNKLCYDAIKEMTYLGWTFQESMRMFPPMGFLMRKCARKYTIPKLDLTIDEGVRILIPLQAWQNDPQYFDNPEVFRPERFHPNEYSEKNKLVYFPFGDGPRACVANRLGRMQSLAGLAAVLSMFSVEPAPKTVRKPVINPRLHIIQGVKSGQPLIFRERLNTKHLKFGTG